MCATVGESLADHLHVGDDLSPPRDQGGIALGTLGTSRVFLAAILAIVTRLTLTGTDRTERTLRSRSGAAS